MPLVIAHRGASGYAPENSLEAFRLATTMEADGVELDVHSTRDGGLVVHHDPVLPGLGRIAELDLEGARRYRLANGERLPILDEVLAVTPSLQAWIEVKALEPTWDRSLLGTIDRAPSPGRCAVHSADHDLIARLGRLRPTLPRGVLSSSNPQNPARQLAAIGATALWQEWTTIDQKLVDLVHQAGAQVIAWTVNEAAIASRLGVMGVDGLCGNYPERLRTA